MMPSNSPRALVARRLELFLTANARVFTAPYGVINGTHASRTGGFYRTVTFGIARTLDAEFKIFNPRNIVLHSSRGDTRFTNVEDAIEFLRLKYNAHAPIIADEE